jgi:5-carboxymethyl-2-hydroxymuconate isomerase
VPHIIIEYSANVVEHHDVDALVATIHESARATGIGPLGGLRTRAVPRTQYRIADGHPDNAMIAIVARLAPGREPEEKLAFIVSVLDAAEAHVDADNGPLAIAWSMEIQEIDAQFRTNRNHVTARLAAEEN